MAKKKVVKKKVIKAKPAAKKSVAKKPVKKIAKKSTPKKVLAKKKSAPKKIVKKVITKKVVSAKPVVKSQPKAKIDYSKAITPLGDRLVIRLTQAEKISAGGIILPDSVTSETGYLKGIVLAAGHGLTSKKGHLKYLDVKVGDTVLFSDYTSTQVTFHGEELHIVHEAEILGVVN